MPESSLRSGLTLRVLAVAVTLLILDGVACYALAAHFANLVYDRWLIDSTRSLSQALNVVDGQIRIDLPRVALTIFQFDAIDKTFYRVSTQRRGLIASDGGLPAVHTIDNNQPQLSTWIVHGQPVRLVATLVHVPGTEDVASVEVGETLRKRATLTTEILVAMAAPQLGLLLVALLFVWFAVGQGLRPLTTVAAAIEARGHDLLTPVSERGLPKEARILVSKINDLLGRLERAMAAQRRFVADAAHQLRTPLATVLLHAERAERATDEEARGQALRGLHTSVARAARLSHQLLALARAEPEAAPTQALTALDLVSVARSAGEDWIPLALERGIDFGFVAPPQPLMIQGHPGLLMELISNLIDNALRYCRPGCNVTLSVAATPVPTLSVEDDGPGISAQDREHIFERFFRGAGQNAEGCGLGLAIVREIATVHGASVQVLSGRNDRGACFIVRFPVRA